MTAATKATEAIIKEIDKRTLLGAAFDCMTDEKQEDFKERIHQIIESEINKETIAQQNESLAYYRNKLHGQPEHTITEVNSSHGPTGTAG